MTFEEKLAQMQAAKGQADAAYAQALSGLRDAYVLTGQAHVETETAWLGAQDDVDLQAAAGETWAAVVAARAALIEAAAEAEVTRRASLAAAWATIREGDVDE